MFADPDPPRPGPTVASEGTRASVLGRRGAWVITAIGLLAGVGAVCAAFVAGGPGSRPKPRKAQDQASLAVALDKGVAAVTSLYSRVEMAVMFDSWRSPVAVGRDLGRPMPQLDVSAPVIALTLLRERQRRGVGFRSLLPTLRRSLAQFDGCAQRDLVLDLQQAVGGIPAARTALAQTLGLGGSRVAVGPAQADTTGPHCRRQALRGVPNPPIQRSILNAAASTWTINDAVRFVAALQSRSFDVPGTHPSISETILNLMRLPKRTSRESALAAPTVSPNWGAARVFAAPCWHLAWETAGRGAGPHLPSIASQIGSVTLRDGHRVAFAVAGDSNRYRLSSALDGANALGITSLLVELRQQFVIRGVACA